MKKRVKSILLIFILFFLLLPLLQQNLSLFAFDPLYGYYNLRDKPQLKWFTWERWFSDKFQDTLSKSLQDHVVFRELLIRLNNQYKLNLFDETDMKNIVVGKENYLFEEGYILEYLGRNFTGKTYIDEKLRRTKWVQDYLKREKNIDLIIVFEPGRASFFPEFIPERYQPQHKTLSNYQYYAQRCKGLDIHNLDLNAYFLSMKTTSPFPLYPKYGVHWSTYGMTLAMDTLIHYIENTRNIDMPEVICNNIISSTEYSDIDWDIEKSMNLLYKLPQSEAMAHLEITFNNDAHKTKPDILTIGDSYCWSIFNAEIPDIRRMLEFRKT